MAAQVETFAFQVRLLLSHPFKPIAIVDTASKKI